MAAQPTLAEARGSARATNLVLGTVALLLCATLTRPVHGVAALLLVGLLLARLESQR